MQVHCELYFVELIILSLIQKQQQFLNFYQKHWMCFKRFNPNLKWQKNDFMLDFKGVNILNILFSNEEFGSYTLLFHSTYCFCMYTQLKST